MTFFSRNKQKETKDDQICLSIELEFIRNDLRDIEMMLLEMDQNEALHPIERGRASARGSLISHLSSTISYDIGSAKAESR